MADTIAACIFFGLCVLLVLAIGNLATGEPPLHRPGHTPGTGWAGWLEPFDGG